MYAIKLRLSTENYMYIRNKHAVQSTIHFNRAITQKSGADRATTGFIKNY